LNKILIFSLGNILFGVDINQIESLSRLEKTKKIAKSPQWVGGLVKYRNQMFPLVKLWEILNLDAPQKKVLLLPSAFDYCAFLISGVKGIYEFETDKESSKIFDLPYLTGFGTFKDKIVIEIRLDNLLTKKQKRTLEKLNKKDGKK
jgi:chemotaxis signal transduction protein